jgi:RND family efflux transporter MFP subunit
VEQEQAETALDLFKRYEFQKEAEKLKSDYEEAVKELERIIAKNDAEISKAEANLKSVEATYKSQADQLEKIREQIRNSTIRATKPGLVVYAGIGNRWQTDQIEEGKKVREQQEIIQIPNTSSMIVKTAIHESVIARIHEGQKAVISIDSLPELKLEGKVSKVAVLPDPQQRWLNPNLKVYSTDIAILGTHPKLKPGMSAQVRIIVNELNDVLMIPIQAVTTEGNRRVCYVKTALGSEKRIIETGDYNDRFIEVRSGLEEGEKVILNIQNMKLWDQGVQPEADEKADATDSEEERHGAVYTWKDRPMKSDAPGKRPDRSGVKRKRPDADHRSD